MTQINAKTKFFRGSFRIFFELVRENHLRFRQKFELVRKNKLG